jgi:hypothetical protein
VAQTTGADSGRNGKVEISTDGTAWTDISGVANNLTVSGGARQVGETYTFAGDAAIVTTGKSTPVDITVQMVYTEITGEGFEVARAIWEGTNVLYLRWSPRGGQTGEFVFTAGPGRMSAFSWPNVDGTTGNPTLAGFTYRGPTPVKSIAA